MNFYEHTLVAKQNLSQKDVDTILIEKYRHLSFYRTPGQAFSGGFSAIFRSFMSLFSSFFVARKLIREQEPDAVILFGGFLSAGLGLAPATNRPPTARW